MKEKLLEWTKLTAAIGSYICITRMTGIGCPILFLTGVPCPGCGMTRAIGCMIKLDFIGAVTYHPLCVLLPFFLLFLLFYHKMGDKIKKVLLGISLVLLLGVYVVRLLEPDNPIVKPDFTNGFIYQVLWWIKDFQSGMVVEPGTRIMINNGQKM